MLRGARVVRRRTLLRAAAVGGVAYRAGKHFGHTRGRARSEVPATPAAPAARRRTCRPS